MKTIKLWNLRVIADCEGRTTKVRAKFTNEKACKEFAQSDEGRDMYGGVGEVSAEILEVYETAEEAGAKNKEKLRQQALSKLTPTERKILGLV